MKVKQLKEILNNCDDNDEVIIDVWDERVINPRAYINSVHAGFDWYSGYVIIVPDKRLIHLDAKK